jgi:predicted lipid carrier protein YhbT
MSEQAALRPACIDEALDWLRKQFDPEAAADLELVYGFDLTGAEGGAFSVRVERGRLEILLGRALEDDVCFRLDARDFFAILAGRANADMLFMEERIEVRGDLSLALKMRRIFRRPA